MRRRWLAPFVLAQCLACNALLGIDFDGTERVSGDGGPGPTDDARTDAASTSDAGDKDVDGGDYLALAEELRAMRVRVASSPGTASDYFTSKSWLYWNDTQGSAKGLRISDGATRAFSTKLIGGNDEVVVVDNVITPSVLDANTGAVIGEIPNKNFIASIDGKLLYFSQESDPLTGVYQWGPSQSTKLGSVGTAAMSRVMHDNDVAILETLPTGFVRVSVSPFVSVVFPRPYQHFEIAPMPEGIVYSTADGGPLRILLAKEDGSTTDLKAAIMGATSDIPLSDRTPLLSIGAYGHWLFFTSGAGILAFRSSDSKLVALQLRLPGERAGYIGLKFVEAAKALVFSVQPDKEGLYYLPVASLLPP